MEHIVHHTILGLLFNSYSTEFSTNKMLHSPIHFVLTVRKVKDEFYALLTAAILSFGFWYTTCIFLLPSLQTPVSFILCMMI